MKALATLGNSLTLRMLSVHSGEMLRRQREIQRPGNLKHWWQRWDNWTCLDSQKPRDDVHQIDEYGQHDDAYYEHDVEWHTGDARDELEEPAYTVGLRTDDPELLEQFDGNLEDADASASRVYASASLSFQEAVPGQLSC